MDVDQNLDTKKKWDMYLTTNIQSEQHLGLAWSENMVHAMYKEDQGYQDRIIQSWNKKQWTLDHDTQPWHSRPNFNQSLGQAPLAVLQQDTLGCGSRRCFRSLALPQFFLEHLWFHFGPFNQRPGCIRRSSCRRFRHRLGLRTLLGLLGLDRTLLATGLDRTVLGPGLDRTFPGLDRTILLLDRAFLGPGRGLARHSLPGTPGCCSQGRLAAGQRLGPWRRGRCWRWRRIRVAEASGLHRKGQQPGRFGLDHGGRTIEASAESDFLEVLGGCFGWVCSHRQASWKGWRFQGSQGLKKFMHCLEGNRMKHVCSKRTLQNELDGYGWFWVPNLHQYSRYFRAKIGRASPSYPCVELGQLARAWRKIPSGNWT